MYDKSDPRAALAPAKSALSENGLVAIAQEGHFYSSPPQVDDATGQSWSLRAQNIVVIWTEAAPGASFARVDQCDEYAVLLPAAGARIEWNGSSAEVPGHSIVFIPPGDSTVTLPTGGSFVRLISTQSKDVVQGASNAAAYDVPRSHIPEFTPWPEPVNGWKIRSYSLDVPKQDGRFGRIFRCTTMMVNVLDPMPGPRDSTKMSPHYHDDFEQVSLAVRGKFTHYLRWPWTTDMADWKDDLTVEMGSPSALVIPPPVIHTTRAIGGDENHLVDIFSPPRRDFSDEPGWVLNADDYPMPT